MVEIAILSYNRPKELRRCVLSLLPLPKDVCVRIHDDRSPNIDQIRFVLADILASQANVVLIENDVNLGYDANLLKAIRNSAAEYVFLLSDDDYLEPECLGIILPQLSGFQKAACAFTRFVEKSYINPDIKINRRDYGVMRLFNFSDLRLNGSVIYNSILFSGLIFNVKAVKDIENELLPYQKSIYMQVAIFSILTSKFGSCFIPGPGVFVGGDGENGFGKNESSVNSGDLVDRSSVHSNLNFNMRLIRVVDMLGQALGSQFIVAFFNEFNFRNFSGMRLARLESRNSLIKYWTVLGGLTRYRRLHHYFLFYSMLILPKFIVSVGSDFAFKIFKKIGKR